MRALLIVLSFAVMAWAYWALSGGSDFVPETLAEADRPTLDLAAAELTAAEVPSEAPSEPTAAPGPAPDAAAAEVLPSEPALPEAVTQTVPEAGTEVAAADLPTEPPTEAPPSEPPASAGPLGPTEALAAIAPDLAAPPSPDLPAPALPATDAAAPALASPAPVEAAALRRVTGDLVNMREGPGTGFDVVAQVVSGELAEVIETDGGWLRVRTPDGAEGWMSARFLARLDG